MEFRTGGRIAGIDARLQRRAVIREIGNADACDGWGILHAHAELLHD